MNHPVYYCRNNKPHKINDETSDISVHIDRINSMEREIEQLQKSQTETYKKFIRIHMQIEQQQDNLYKTKENYILQLLSKDSPDIMNVKIVGHNLAKITYNNNETKIIKFFL